MTARLRSVNLLAGLPAPTTDKLRDIRVAAGITQRQAAALAGLREPMRWSDYERGLTTISTERWALFLLAVGMHPTLRVAVRRSSPSD